jgi:hypothetical protein
MTNNDGNDDVAAPRSDASFHEINVTSPKLPQETDFVLEEKEEIVVETVSEDDSSNVKKQEIPQGEVLDPIERRVVFVVHVALTFFCVLVVVAVIMALLMVSQFGTLVFGLVSLLVGIVIAFAYFLDKSMRVDEHWKPLQSRIHQIKVMATEAVLQEVRNFQLDWHEHLLLTDGKGYASDSCYYAGEAVFTDKSDLQNTISQTKTVSTSGVGNEPKRKGGRSVVFQLVKPILKLRGIRTRRKQQKQDERQSSRGTEYMPPIV